MTSAEQLSNQFAEVYLQGTWIAGTNLKNEISSITFEHAVNKYQSLNTVAALTFHLNYYLAGILEVFNGGGLNIKDKYSFNLPDLQTEGDWIELQNTFTTNAQSFEQHIEIMSDIQLSEDFVKPEYGSYYRNIQGVIEHGYYHLGQIVLIKKLLKE